MGKRILFVSGGEQSILIKSMIRTFTESGFEVVLTECDVNAMKNFQADIFIVYFENDFLHFTNAIKYIHAQLAAVGRKKAFFAIGNQSELAALEEQIPKQLITDSFEKPVNMQHLLQQLHNFASGDSTGRKRILVVDDDAIMLRTMKTHLSSKYEVYMANSGINAISLLAEREVDLILLDYEMPVASGLQVFEMIRAEPKTAHIPVIFLTGKDDRNTVVKVLAAKPEKYLLKTLPPEELVREIDVFFKGF